MAKNLPYISLLPNLQCWDSLHLLKDAFYAICGQGCGRFSLWPLWSLFVTVLVCGPFGLCLICDRFSLSLFRLWPSQHVAATNCYHFPTLTFSYDIVHMLFSISHEWQYVFCLLKIVAALIVINELYSEWYIFPNCKYCPAWNVSVISNNRTPFLAFLILQICHNIMQR